MAYSNCTGQVEGMRLGLMGPNKLEYSPYTVKDQSPAEPNLLKSLIPYTGGGGGGGGGGGTNFF